MSAVRSVEFGVLVVTVVLLTWTWVVYTALMAARARRAAPSAARDATPMALSVIIATRDDPAVVAPRVRNIVELPDASRADDIVVSVDPSSRWALDDYRRALGERVRVIAGDAPGGKAAALNAGARAARCDVIVLADSQQRFTNGSLDALVAAMAQPGVAGVSGTVRQRSGDATLDAYWRTDTLVRSGQSAAHSVVTTTGQISAFQRAVYPVLPPGLICDDLFATAAVIMQGHRVTFTEHAVALDDRTFTRSQNLQRKIRTLSGLVQVCQLLPAVLHPRRNPIWMHFVSQKLLRLVSPVIAMMAGWAILSLILQLVWTASVARLVALVAFAPLLSVRLPLDRAAAWLGPASFFWIPLVALFNGLRRNYNLWEQQPTLRVAATASDSAS